MVFYQQCDYYDLSVYRPGTIDYSGQSECTAEDTVEDVLGRSIPITVDSSSNTKRVRKQKYIILIARPPGSSFLIATPLPHTDSMYQLTIDHVINCDPPPLVNYQHTDLTENHFQSSTSVHNSLRVNVCGDLLKVDQNDESGKFF